MSKVVFKENSKALQVSLLDTKAIKSHPQKAMLEKARFKGAYKQACLDLGQNTLYIGVEVKLGNRTADPFAKLHWYELGAKVANALKSTKVDEISLQSTSVECKTDDLERFLLGILQASWHYDEYLNGDDAKSIDVTVFVSPKFTMPFSELVKHELAEKVEVLNEAILLTRQIVNEPPETLHPHSAADLAIKTFKPLKNTAVTVYDEKWLSAQGMNGIMFVGRGSRYQPRLVHVVVKPSGQVKHRIALVGKGLTYDSGGLDIKVGGHMKTMKMDMAGAATMFGATKALAELGLKNTELHWLSAFAENMVGPDSYKSDDIIPTYSGQTVEVFNTDAEGRLTLADVLAYATTLNVDYIVDAATLTGAAIMAVSERYTALMGNSAKFEQELLSVFEQEGEYIAKTTMPEVLRPAVKGEISDLINTSTMDRQAGHITAGLFLSHFVNQKNFRNPKLKISKPVDVPWIHLDIAGSAYNEGKNGLGTKGATGQSVRSLFAWIQSQDK